MREGFVVGKKTKTEARQDAGSFEIEWESSELDAVLREVEEPATSYRQASAADRLRVGIVSDRSKWGRWLELMNYHAMPKRVALGVASSWRRARPESFGGDRQFEARILPADEPARRTLAVTSETLYAVAVRYPSQVEPDAARLEPEQAVSPWQEMQEQTPTP